MIPLLSAWLPSIVGLGTEEVVCIALHPLLVPSSGSRPQFDVLVLTHGRAHEKESKFMRENCVLRGNQPAPACWASRFLSMCESEKENDKLSGN